MYGVKAGRTKYVRENEKGGVNFTALLLTVQRGYCVAAQSTVINAHFTLLHGYSFCRTCVPSGCTVFERTMVLVLIHR